MMNLCENMSGRCRRIRRSARQPFVRHNPVDPNALGVATVYEYDVRGNKTYEGGGTYPVTYAYDAFNIMTNMTTYGQKGSDPSV